MARAVLCYAFQQNTVPIDTNVIRLFMRYFDLTSGIPAQEPILPLLLLLEVFLISTMILRQLI